MTDMTLFAKQRDTEINFVVNQRIPNIIEGHLIFFKKTESQKKSNVGLSDINVFINDHIR